MCVALHGKEARCWIMGMKEFRNPDFDEIYNRLNKKIIFDGRNIYNKKLSKYGFTLYQIGC